MPELRRSSAAAGSLRNRIRYRFDNLLARGTWAVLLWLGVVTLLAVLVSSGLLAIFGVDLAGSQDNSWLEDFWQSTLRILDSGTMAADVGWGRRVLALLVTVFGLLIAGTLIGLIANGVEQRVDAMRRGRSTVIESGHVVILGASSRLPVIVEQLALANRTRRSNAIVVLADVEPVDLREDLRATVTDLHGSRVVFRSGEPARAQDLAMVALRDARAVIVLTGGGVNGDAGVVKAVLAAGAELGGFDRLPIVAELGDPDTAVSLVRACGGDVHPVVAAQSVARITAFALREPGLNQVVEELVDFRGCDVYVRDMGDLAGLSFAETVVRFEKTRPIGRMRADGYVELNPDPGTRLGGDDRLIVIADDDVAPTRAQRPFPTNSLARGPLRPGPRAERPREHVLIVGWNALGTELLASLDEFAASGSSVEVVYDARLFDPEDLRLPALDRLDLSVTPDRRATWQMGDRATSHLTSIVLLACRRVGSTDESDSRMLLTLMMLRRDLEARGASPRVVVELLEADNVELARMTGADDYVVSDAITSRLMTQLAEQPQRRPILLSLYAADGPSVRLVPARELGLTGGRGHDEIITTAYAAGLLAIGVRRGHEVVLNARASERVHLDDDDQIVAIG